ncbi:alpha/beta fold hydrolase [Aeromicrobium sp. CF3.5]|uniref:alpha/beta fold hydrolase n=1 Tax=Aeromicrobium sp. CF3.5 TaxID=3373078 RepID=UPI003EE640DC
MNRTTRIIATAGAFVATGLTATVLNGRAQSVRRRRRGEEVEFGSVHSTPLAITASDGVSINVEVDEAESKTPVVVFVHGWVCTLDAWHYQRLAMRGAVRLVFMDLRSHGASGRSGPSNSSLPDLAGDLAHVITQVAPRGPVILVGHSMGGMAVMRLAVDQPELFTSRVRGVVLIGTSTGRLMRGSPALRRIVPLIRLASPVLDWGRSFNSYSIIKHWGLGPDAEERHVDMTNEMLLRAPLHALTDFYSNFVDLDLSAAMPTIATAHTTIVCGTDDQLTPPEHSRRLAEAIDGSTLRLVDGAGHMIAFEEHEMVTAAIEDVVEQVREEMS